MTTLVCALAALAAVPRTPASARAPSRARAHAAESAAPRPLAFAGAPATDRERQLVGLLLIDLGELVPTSEWLPELTPWDALRYVRAALNERSGCDDDQVLSHARNRLTATAHWRSSEGVDGIVRREPKAFAMPSFFLAHKQTTPAEEARWLMGSDRAGRPVALFQVDRHFPGEISIDLWSQFVVFNAEATIEERGVARGPGGQFSLVVDRSRSSLRNQYVIEDRPKVCTQLLPALKTLTLPWSPIPLGPFVFVRQGSQASHRGASKADCALPRAARCGVHRSRERHLLHRVASGAEIPLAADSRQVCAHPWVRLARAPGSGGRWRLRVAGALAACGRARCDPDVIAAERVVRAFCLLLWLAVTSFALSSTRRLRCSLPPSYSCIRFNMTQKLRRCILVVFLLRVPVVTSFSNTLRLRERLAPTLRLFTRMSLITLRPVRPV